jgi:hypothetical protein
MGGDRVGKPLRFGDAAPDQPCRMIGLAARLNQRQRFEKRIKPLVRNVQPPDERNDRGIQVSR